MDDVQLSLVFGDQALIGLSNRKAIEAEIDKLYQENDILLQQARNAFHVDLTLADIIVASASGVVCGAVSGCFKSYVPQDGKFKHKHGTRRTAIDHKVPKPVGMHGSVQGLHRQIGPGHDLGRFKEALDLMSGKTSDFPLWGKNISDYTGGVLHSGNIILSLDYASLLILGSSSIKYISSSATDYRVAMDGVAEINHSLEAANQKWFASFKHDVLMLAQSDNFEQTFSPKLILQKHESVIQALEQGEEKKKSLKQELQEWNIDETV